MIGKETDEGLKEPFEWILSRYQVSLEEIMRSRDFVVDCVDLLHWKGHKISLNCNGSFIDSLDFVKQYINEYDDKYLWYAVTIV